MSITQTSHENSMSFLRKEKPKQEKKQPVIGDQRPLLTRLWEGERKEAEFRFKNKSYEKLVQYGMTIYMLDYWEHHYLSV